MVVVGVPLPATKMVGVVRSSNEDAIEEAPLKEFTEAAATSDVSYSNEGSIGSCESGPRFIWRPLFGEGSLTRAGTGS